MTTIRLRPNYTMRGGDLLGIDANPKTIKGRKLGIATGIMYMAPASSAGLKNLCPYASDGCLAACLSTSGKGGIPAVRDTRIRKAREFQTNRAGFMLKLDLEIERLALMAHRDGLLPAVRLNGTTDVMWERESFIDSDGVYWANLMSKHSTVTFYDYTKIPMRYRQNLPSNYDITFSLSENNDSDALEALKMGHNVAAVFYEIPESFMNHDVIIGDDSDARFFG